MIINEASINVEKWAAFRIAREKGGHVLIPDQWWIVGVRASAPSQDEDQWVYLVECESKEDAIGALELLDRAARAGAPAPRRLENSPW